MSEFDKDKVGADEAGEDVFKVVVDNDKPKTRAWSVAALILGIASILCCVLYWFGLAAGAAAIVFVIISRKTLGYFDGLCIGALFTAIFGIIFSGAVTVLMLASIDISSFEQLLGEMISNS